MDPRRLLLPKTCLNKNKMSGNEAKKTGSAPTENPKLLEMIAKLMAQHHTQGGVSPANPAKPIEEHKFWRTQPVPKSAEDSEKEQGPVEEKTVDQVVKAPQSLPDGFEWCKVDITSEKEMEELYDLLFHNYVEDPEEQFRFKYTPTFLKWALSPPGWTPDYHVGIRATQSNKLLAFISAIPAELVVRGVPVKSVEINFLCVHKQLRAKRMAPVLIKEITRVVNLKNVWQALFTAGTRIPTPVSTTRYYHRVFNWTKLFDVGFAGLPPGSTPAQEIAKVALPSNLTYPGFRPFEEKDVLQVHALLTSFLSKYDLYPEFSVEEIKHWFLPAGDDSPVISYVVENSEGNISEFISAYGLESSVLGEDVKHKSINIAYTFYYASTASNEQLKDRLLALFKVFLVKVKNAGYDVMNALTVMDNPLFIDALLFKAGDGLLNYNLFNWKTESIHGGIDKNMDVSKPGGVGLVLL